MKRRTGVCTECRLRVYIRKDATAWTHRMPGGADDQVCFGSGYTALHEPEPPTAGVASDRCGLCNHHTFNPSVHLVYKAGELASEDSVRS